MAIGLRRGDVVRLTRDIRVSTLWGFSSRVAVPAGTVGVITAAPGMFQSPIVRFDGGISFSVKVNDLERVETSRDPSFLSWLR